VEEVFCNAIKGDPLQIRREGDDANANLLVRGIQGAREWPWNITYQNI
jgi:hypothetical protein